MQLFSLQRMTKQNCKGVNLTICYQVLCHLNMYWMSFQRAVGSGGDGGCGNGDCGDGGCGNGDCGDGGCGC